MGADQPTTKQRHQNRHQDRHRAGLGIGIGVAAAVALAGFGVWGTNALAGTSPDGPGAVAAGDITGHPVAAADAVPRQLAGHIGGTTTSTTADTTTTAGTAGHARHSGQNTGDHSTDRGTDRTGCGQCATVFTVPLPAGAHLDGVRWSDGPSEQGWLDYYADGRLVARSGLSEDSPQPGDADHPVTGTCQLVAHVQRCAVLYDTGAHSTAVDLLTVDPAHGIRTTARALGGAPGGWLTDLDGDGISDVTLDDVDFGTDYASSPQVYHTYLQRHGRLVSTGCSAPSANPQAPPRHPETGHCPANG